MPLAERAALLRSVHAAVAREAESWATTASRMKRIPDGSSLEGEEWLSGPYAVLDSLATLAQSLDRLAAGRSTLDGETLGIAVGGRVTVTAVPRSPGEELLLSGFRVEVWMPPGATPAEVRAHAGLGARHPERTGGIGLVLGAGNVTAIPTLDVLSELMAHNRVVICALNPVMADMLPVFERAFEPLVVRGLLRFVVGGAVIGGYLARHPSVAHVHVTGSLATHDAVVFGPGGEGARRRAANTPILRAPITSELGGVSPIIVVPGRWSRADLRYQAEHVATMRLHNGGYNCIAGQTVVLSSEWPQRQAFLDELRAAMDRAPARPAWYPGSDGRVARAAQAWPDAERLGPDGGRLLIDVPAGEGRELGTAELETAELETTELETMEYFAPVLGVVQIAGTDGRFLDDAVDLVHDRFAGTLGVNILIDPGTQRRLGARVERAIARLRYGTVAVNAWTGVGFGSGAAPWGAYPGNRLDDAGSGIGTVHNALLLSAPEKTVVRGPFRPFPRSVLGGERALSPTPPWFVGNLGAALTARRMVEYQSDPTPAALRRVLAAATLRR